MKIFARIAATVALAFGLAACGGGAAPEAKAPPAAEAEIDGVTKIDRYREITEVEVTLKDGRTVICLALSDYKAGGLHCLDPEPR